MVVPTLAMLLYSRIGFWTLGVAGLSVTLLLALLLHTRALVC